MGLANDYVDQSKQIRNGDVWRFQLMTAAGLRLVSHLNVLSPHIDYCSSLDFIVCLASYSDAKEPWVWPGSEGVAIKLLRSGRTQASTRPVTQALLEDRIRPVFARSKTPAVTAQGRKSINPVLGRVDPIELETADKQWRYQGIHMIAVFRWVLQQLNVWSTDPSGTLG